MAEDAWNTRNPDRVVQVYTEDTRWRNRAEFPVGREEVRLFLARKWARELDYRLIKELWVTTWACSPAEGSRAASPKNRRIVNGARGRARRAPALRAPALPPPIRY